MSADPGVSVVMSVRAQDPADPMLSRAVESILQQTYRDFEFLIIDDASSRAVAERLKAWSRQDPRIVIKTNPANLGLSRSLHETVPQARGALIARQDADDFSLPERLEKQVRRFEADPQLVLLGTWTRHRDESGKEALQSHPDDHEALLRALYYTNPYCHASTMFRKGAYHRSGGYDPTLSTSQDLDLWVKLQSEGRLGMVEECLVERTIHGKSISRQKAWNQVRNSVKIRLRYCGDRPSLQGIGLAAAGAAYHAWMTLKATKK